MHIEGLGPSSAAPFETEWRWEAIGDPDAPEAYRFSLARTTMPEPIWEVSVPASVIAEAVFLGRRPELMIDTEEGRLMFAGQGLDDDLLDALTCALSKTRVLSLAADVLESEGLGILADQGSEAGELGEELARLQTALSTAQKRLDDR
jgi:hypothetical protein